MAVAVAAGWALSNRTWQHVGRTGPVSVVVVVAIMTAICGTALAQPAGRLRDNTFVSLYQPTVI